MDVRQVGVYQITSCRSGKLGAVTDDDYMTEALTQAQTGNTMFGAVLVRDGIEAAAYNTMAATHDPSAHAELNLIRDYCKAQKLASLGGYTLYTTAEPCPMCAALISFTGVSEVVFGVSVKDLADLGVPQIELSCEAVVSRGPSAVSVRGGVLWAACLEHCRTLAEQGTP